MNDLFAPPVNPEAIYSDSLRIMPVTGDFMSPRLRGGWDYVLVKPINKLVGEGTYIYDDGHGPVMTNVQLMFDRIRLFSENQHYTDHYLTREQFEGSILGFVVADIKVKDTRFLAGSAP
jgi:hypothetical protein